LSTGNFVVSHGTSEHKVSSIDTNGRIIQTYGGYLGSTLSMKYKRYHLAVDMHDNVLVAMCMCSQHKVQLLSPTLTSLGDIVIPGHDKLNEPFSFHFDELNHRLYIGEYSGGCLFALHDLKDIN